MQQSYEPDKNKYIGYMCRYVMKENKLSVHTIKLTSKISAHCDLDLGSAHCDIDLESAPCDLDL